MSVTLYDNMTTTENVHQLCWGIQPREKKKKIIIVSSETQNLNVVVRDVM
jgi:hypothetical protein